MDNKMLKEITGKIRPQGWILEHLLRDKHGITGHLGELCADVSSGLFEDKKVRDEIDGCWSSWWPGESEGNWRDALARLAFALDDQELIREMKNYVERLLRHQEEDGYMGIFLPNERFGNGARSGELWTQSRLMTVLLTYYRHTGEAQVLDALERLCDLIVRQYGPLAGGRSLYQVPDEDGSKTHSLMVIEPILALYAEREKPEYLAFCEFLYEDYSRYAPDAVFPCYDLARDKATAPRVPLVGHGAHTCEQLRIPLLLYQATGKKDYYSIFLSAFEKLKRSLSLSGSCKSDELIGAHQGKVAPEKTEGLQIGECFPIPGIGYEYCSTTEMMFSLTAAVQITGSLHYADYEEWMVMNAAMAARRQDGKAIQYLCADNLYRATKEVGDRWDYSPTHTDAAVCCAPNSGKVMPYHLSTMWLSGEDGTLYALYYGPCVLHTVCGGQAVEIEQRTRYPFEKGIAFHIRCQGDFRQKIVFRVPFWAEGCRLLVNGAPVDAPCLRAGSGRGVALERTFADGDVVTLLLEAFPRLVAAVDGTRAAVDGPLLYSLPIAEVGEDSFHYEKAPFCDTNYTPAEGENWEYTLLYDSRRPGEYLRERRYEGQGFEWENPPVTLRAQMLSSWAVPEWVELVPIGCTTLRRTTFPFIDRAQEPRSDTVRGE
ncbi:MAG TPA: glycoside hydrolase family 127 protein [Firmicutes bacterium]|nr:glycoside hydrolase family 127 protein [Bacillota bacterium]